MPSGLRAARRSSNARTRLIGSFRTAERRAAGRVPIPRVGGGCHSQAAKSNQGTASTVSRWASAPWRCSAPGTYGLPAAVQRRTSPPDL